MPKRRRNPQPHLAVSPWMSKADFDLRPGSLNQQERLEHYNHCVVEDNIIKDRAEKLKRSELQGHGSAWPSINDSKGLVQGSQQYPLREPGLILDDGATTANPKHMLVRKSSGKKRSCFSGNCVIAIDAKGGMHGKLSKIISDGKQIESSRYFSGSLVKTYRDCMRDEEWTLALLSFQNIPENCGGSLDLLAECSGGDALQLCSPIELNVEEQSYLSNQPIIDNLLWNKTIFTFTCHYLKDARCDSCSQDMELEKEVNSDLLSILHHFGLEADEVDCINSGVFELHLV